MKTTFSNVFFIFVLSLHVYWVQANPVEINHLLNFVEHTQCQYERNGKQYNGIDALAHIKKKYHYYQGDIKSTEDFIELSATKSTMSGKAYQVHCPNKKAIASKQWLLDELASFRNTQP
ncbi:DUF5329 family protein [Bermanella sp. WJH001]|uniref:DUF5329 domain-containing protein n=1 Tax=Bermanella sp. WJH001 TaxID=3048005 RepID=UPI0024BF0BAC|nr:DUF5329 domain-containing protein [Bermanella sp. WJH001]MDJ1539178.1 DUF5329 domain-containing protein [Bermanella sp. WJH001]